jgi:hypothetical protein
MENPGDLNLESAEERFPTGCMADENCNIQISDR